jgi:TolA-binding protein
MQNPIIPEDDRPEEALLTWFFNLWSKVEKNYTTILAGLGGAVVAGVLIIFIYNYRSQQSEEAQSKLGEVYISLFEGRVDDAINQSAQLKNEYAGTPAGKEALMSLANLQFEQNRVSEARASFQSFLDEYGSDDLLAYGAWSGLATCLEAEGKFSEAAQKFKSYADRYPDLPFSPVALKEAGRCFQLAQDTTQAIAAYQKVVSKYKESSIYRVAANELLMMGVDLDS